MHRMCSCIPLANYVVGKISFCAYYVEISAQITHRFCIAQEANPIYAQKFGNPVQTAEGGRLGWKRRLRREWSVMLEG